MKENKKDLRSKTEIEKSIAEGEILKIETAAKEYARKDLPSAVVHFPNAVGMVRYEHFKAGAELALSLLTSPDVNIEQLKDSVLLVESAKELFLKKFPPAQFGEDEDCETIWEALDEYEQHLQSLLTNNSQQ